MRKFSIPFNGVDSDTYLELIEQYSEHIESIFTGVSFLCNNQHSVRQILKVNDYNYDFSPLDYIEIYDENVKQFLKKSFGKYNRLITLNSIHYNLNLSELHDFLETRLFPFIDDYKIDGCICTDFIMAKLIHQTFPYVEIHTSCNCFQWNIREMDLWRKECGASVFNPPREILRTPVKLKEMHDAGFKIKAIVNESCLFGCPQQINHCVVNASGKEIFRQCNLGDITNFFKGNWVLPRWLDKLDEYVDIYKISGRLYPIEFLIEVFDAYINRKEVDNLPNILTAGNARAMFETGIKVPSSMIHDKLLTCECKECDKTCFMCRDLMTKLLIQNNIPLMNNDLGFNCI